MNDLAPFTGFGDDQHDSIKFSILMGSDGKLPQPVATPRVSKMTTASGGRVIKQHRGFTEWTWTWTLEFATIADYELMVSLQGESATLRLLAGVTPTMGGFVDPILDTQYLHLPETDLASLEPIEITPEGIVEAVATFERPYVAPTLPEPQPWPPTPEPDPFGPALLVLPLAGDLEGETP